MLAAVLLTSSLAVTARAAPLVVPGIYQPDDSNTGSHLTAAALVPVAYFAGRILSEMPFSRAPPLPPAEPIPKVTAPKLPEPPSPPTPQANQPPKPPPLKPKPVQSVPVSLVRKKPRVRSPLVPNKVRPNAESRIDWAYVEKVATSAEVGFTPPQFRRITNFLNSLLHNDHRITDIDWKEFGDLSRENGADTKLKKVTTVHLWNEVNAAKLKRMDSDAGE
jgi:outer membrane biosynthesis protein TonB